MSVVSEFPMAAHFLRRRFTGALSNNKSAGLIELRSCASCFHKDSSRQIRGCVRFASWISVRLIIDSGYSMRFVNNW